MINAQLLAASLLTEMAANNQGTCRFQCNQVLEAWGYPTIDMTEKIQPGAALLRFCNHLGERKTDGSHDRHEHDEPVSRIQQADEQRAVLEGEDRV